ncbi:MAG TPA: hypothetical protein PLO59_00670, partial [Bacteroidia bacterium]|nr:hypothetical protein [Bacteroidia bacterium]
MNKYAIILILFFAWSCKKNEPDNPFTNNVVPVPADTINPASIAGLHKNIFAVRCAVPGCHDGSFEPDFRTVQSTYSTLVYHKPIKNDSANSFLYRITPYQVNKSWLYERVTTNDAVLGRMPLYSSKLSDIDLKNIENWINNGAPDINNQPTPPLIIINNPPQVKGYVAIDSNNVRLDTVRLNNISYNPFLIPHGLKFTLVFLLEDDSTAIGNLQQNMVKISSVKDDFSS